MDREEQVEYISSDTGAVRETVRWVEVRATPVGVLHRHRVPSRPRVSTRPPDYLSNRLTAPMVANSGDMVRCEQCGTEFPASDAAQMAAHAGHPLEHIEQG